MLDPEVRKRHGQLTSKPMEGEEASGTGKLCGSQTPNQLRYLEKLSS